MVREACLIAVLASAMGSAALAGEHPYSGYFTAATNPAFPSAGDALACALSFSEQKPDGSFTNYHVDLDLFRRTHDVAYLAYNSGHCGYDSDLSLESCTIDWDTDPSQTGGQLFTMIGNINAVFITAWIVESREAVLIYKATGAMPYADRFALSRCRFDPDFLRLAMTGRKSDYPVDRRYAVSQPNADQLADPLTREIAKAMGLVQQ